MTLATLSTWHELVRNIPNARYVELPGTDHIPFVGDNAEEIVEAVEEYEEKRAKAP